MKKFSTLSLALIASASAFAASENASAVDASNVSGIKVEKFKAEIQKIDNTQEAVESGLLSDVIESLAAEGSSYDDITVQYAYPTGTLFNYVFFSVNNQPGYWFGAPAYNVLPAFTDVTFPNNSYSVVEGKRLRATGLDYSWTIGETTNKSEYDYSMETYPSFYHNSGFYAPVLGLGDKTYQLGKEGTTTTGQTKFFPEFFVTGGAPYISQEDIDYYTQVGQGRSDFYTEYKLTNAGIEGSTGYRNEGIYNLGKGNATQVNAKWGTRLPDGCTDAKLVQLGQLIPDPGQPWSLSSITLSVAVRMSAGATFDVCFYGVTADGAPDRSKLINKYTYVAEAAVGNPVSPEAIDLEIPFTTLDELGDEIGYKMIDGGLFMIFEGAANNDKITTFCPLIWGYPIINSATVLNNFMVDSLYGFVSCKEDGEEVTYQATNGWVFGDDPITYPVSFNFTMKAEYPFMQPDSYFSATENKWVAAEEAKEFTLNIKSANDMGLYRVLCSGSADDLAIYCADGSDVPEWLTVSAENANDFFTTGLTGDARAYVISFSLTDNATAGGCEVVVEYKGIKNVYKINPDLSGIEGVVDNGVETVASEYYDLQGRKLSVEPLNGLFIRKDLKADGSVKAVKVVK